MNPSMNYVRFRSDNFRLDFSFLYPGDWPLRETPGENYDQVTIVGPANTDQTFGLNLTVTVRLASKGPGSSDSPDLYAADYLEKAKRLPDFKEMSRARGSIADLPAIEIEASYTLPLPLNTVHARHTPIIERRIFLIKAGRVYEIAYSATQENSYEFLDVFKYVVRTFELREETSPMTYQPAITAIAVPALHESTSEYKTDK
jgi:hypothetical protein